ncbi:hypothetical protein G9A89_001140 [Geosiphon pyriformis]|nr:hypothetical protein G9A89_001140 [Geosiphon pyriformis]
MGNVTRKFSRNHSSNTTLNKICIINGRKFFNNKDVCWPHPIDNNELDRLQMEHYIIQHSWQANFVSPIYEVLRSGGSVLDIGCGPGTWALEIAFEFPESFVTGIDLTTIFPTQIKPRNTNFFEHNISMGCPWSSAANFDFIHQRFVAPGIRAKDWERVLVKEYARILKSGGWLEIIEGYLLVNPGPIGSCLFDALNSYYASRGAHVKITKYLKKYLTNNNQFTNIKHQEKDIPIGSWAGSTGLLTIDNFVSLFDSISAQLSEFMNIDMEEYNCLTMALSSEVNEYKTCWKIERFVAQKVITET